MITLSLIDCRPQGCHFHPELDWLQGWHDHLELICSHGGPDYPTWLIVRLAWSSWACAKCRVSVIILNLVDCRVGVITLNRPKALNALCSGLMDELIKGKHFKILIYQIFSFFYHQHRVAVVYFCLLQSWKMLFLQHSPILTMTILSGLLCWQEVKR